MKYHIIGIPEPEDRKRDPEQIFTQYQRELILCEHCALKESCTNPNKEDPSWFCADGIGKSQLLRTP